jgi:uncharacterized protein (DUF58 family)
MIPREVAQKVKLIEVTTKKAVTATFAGDYASAFKGRGMEFDEVRAYQMGDDIRAINWMVTARTGKPHTKRFVEERELTIMLAVDLSGSGVFGSGSKSKQEVAAEVAAVLALAAVRNNDRVGLLIFTDRLELFVPPRKGMTHVLRIVRDLLVFEPKGRGTRISRSMESMENLLKRRAVVFLISDFIDTDFETALQVSARRHDLIALSLRDPRELELPKAGLVTVEDAETGERRVVDTSSDAVRTIYAAENAARLEGLHATFARHGIDHVAIAPGDDYVVPLARLFRTREARR